jgi:hypothetical protein
MLRTILRRVLIVPGRNRNEEPWSAFAYMFCQASVQFVLTVGTGQYIICLLGFSLQPGAVNQRFRNAAEEHSLDSQFSISLCCIMG